MIIGGTGSLASGSVLFYSDFSPVSVTLSGGTAPYTLNLNLNPKISTPAFQNPIDSSKITLFPLSESTINFYFSDSTGLATDSDSIIVSP
jgi:hypothetical protein